MTTTKPISILDALKENVDEHWKENDIFNYPNKEELRVDLINNLLFFIKYELSVEPKIK